MSETESREDLLRELTNELTKDYNKTLDGDAISLASDGMLSDVKYRIPTGSTQLDLLLRGGIPLGRAVEILGPEDSGKSTLATHLLANIQKFQIDGVYGQAILIDSESVFDRARAAKLGVNTKELIVVPAKTVERGFNYLKGLLTKMHEGKLSNIPTLVVWDTIANTKTEIEANSELGEAQMLSKPKLLKDAERRFTDMLPKYNCTIVFVNQVIGGPNVMMEDSPGGRAIKFWSSFRIRVLRKGFISDNIGPAGINVEARVIKTKVGGPRPITDRIVYTIKEDGIDDLTSCINFLIENGSTEVKRSGAYTKFVYEGIPEFSALARDYSTKVTPEVYERIKDSVAKKLLSPDGYASFSADKQGVSPS